MKNTLLFAFIIIFLSFDVFSQNTIPNGGFEDWVKDASGLFEEPAGNWWGTLNRLRLLGPSAPITTTKTSDAHSGNFAAMLENKMFGSIKISAILTTGYFDSKATPPDNFKEGRSFNGRPQKMTGWYKYKAANGDSCGAYINLTKWNAELNKKDTIAEGTATFYDQGTMNSYLKFDIPLTYYSDKTPDTIKISFIASAGTRSFGTTGNAQIGSTMFVDDVAIEGAMGVVIPMMSETKFYVHGVGQNAHLMIEDNSLASSKLIVYDLNGCEITRFDLIAGNNDLLLNIQSKGVYYFVAIKDGKRIGGGLFQI